MAATAHDQLDRDVHAMNLLWWGLVGVLAREDRGRAIALNVSEDLLGLLATMSDEELETFALDSTVHVRFADIAGLEATAREIAGRGAGRRLRGATIEELVSVSARHATGTGTKDCEIQGPALMLLEIARDTARQSVDDAALRFGVSEAVGRLLAEFDLLQLVELSIGRKMHVRPDVVRRLETRAQKIVEKAPESRLHGLRMAELIANATDIVRTR